MTKGKTATGFSFKIDAEARDDMELLENITRFDAGEHTLLPKLIEELLGKEQKERLYDHCRGKSGRVSARMVISETKAILEEIQKSNDKATKN